MVIRVFAHLAELLTLTDQPRFLLDSIVMLKYHIQYVNGDYRKYLSVDGLCVLYCERGVFCLNVHMVQHNATFSLLIA